MSNLSWEHNEYLERRQRERDYEIAQEERDAAQARTALEMAFEERAHCSERCFDNALHTPECLASTAAIAEPIGTAIAGWLTSQAVARRAAAPSYAAIGNGLFVRVGTGRKRRAA